MSNRTQLNIPTPDLSDEPAVYLNPGGDGGPFAVVTLGPQIWLYIHDAAHARTIAAAFTKAADLLGAAHAPEPVPAGLCPATIPSEHPGGHFVCTRGAGHDGGHEARGSRPEGEPPLTWPHDAPACASCGATTRLVAVRDIGSDGAVVHYCDDAGACARRRHTSAVTA